MRLSLLVCLLVGILLGCMGPRSYRGSWREIGRRAGYVAAIDSVTRAEAAAHWYVIDRYVEDPNAQVQVNPDGSGEWIGETRRRLDLYRIDFVEDTNTVERRVYSGALFFPADTSLDWIVGLWNAPLPRTMLGAGVR